jgi:hypothetical protein
MSAESVNYGYTRWKTTRASDGKVLRQTLSVCGCNCWLQDKREKEFHGYLKAVCVMDRSRGSKLMALNTPNTSANAVPDGEYLNLVVRGIEELNKKIRHASCT